jgi:hypothetical protein
MKPALPEKYEVESPSGKIKLVVVDFKATVTAGDMTFTWDERFHYPKDTLISDKAQLIYFLGGLGDPGLSLGDVDIRKLGGSQVQTVKLTNHLPDLEKWAEEWRTKMGPFPWISSARLVSDGAAIEIGVCDKKTAVVHADDGHVEIR